MDRLDVMRLFTRIVERRSFTMAASDLEVPRSTATKVISELEARLGVLLLQRTTRSVRPTLDGDVYYERCLRILDEIEDADNAFTSGVPKGMLRVEVQGTLARHFILPGLPDFFVRYPDIEISMSESERWVDLVQEGVDCVLRYGNLRSSDLIARKVAMLQRITCATPGYLEQYGVPADIDSLSGHLAVGLRSITTGNVAPLEFIEGGQSRMVSLASKFVVTGTESYLEGIRLGFGIAQVPLFHIKDDLMKGALVPLLTQTPAPSMPVSILYQRSRQLSPRARVFLEWATQQFASRDLTSRENE